MGVASSLTDGVVQLDNMLLVNVWNVEFFSQL